MIRWVNKSASGDHYCGNGSHMTEAMTSSFDQWTVRLESLADGPPIRSLPPRGAPPGGDPGGSTPRLSALRLLGGYRVVSHHLKRGVNQCRVVFQAGCGVFCQLNLRATGWVGRVNFLIRTYVGTSKKDIVWTSWMGSRRSLIKQHSPLFSGS